MFFYCAAAYCTAASTDHTVLMHTFAIHFWLYWWFSTILLVPVLWLTFTVDAETVLSPAQWDLMNTIRCSGETLLTLITDILDFSRIEADKMVLSPSEFHLQTVIEAAMEIAGLHAAQKRLQVTIHCMCLLCFHWSINWLVTICYVSRRCSEEKRMLVISSLHKRVTLLLYRTCPAHTYLVLS